MRKKPPLRALPDEPAMAGEGLERFRYEARFEGRPIVALRAVELPTGEFAVETETFPAGPLSDDPPLRRTFSFPTHEKARRFADEALTALEYQNCVVNEHDPVAL